MRFSSRARSAMAGLAVFLLALNGCGSNPATGGQSLLGMSEEQEIQLSKEEHPKILAEFGGEVKIRRCRLTSPASEFCWQRPPSGRTCRGNSPS